MAIRIGTSGWSYDHWDGVLYPPGLPARDRLGVYTANFTTVELNASFYRWPREATFASWNRRLPPYFHMTVKAPRGLTHAKRLYSPEAVSYTHLRAHETRHDLVCRLLLEKKKIK